MHRPSQFEYAPASLFTGGFFCGLLFLDFMLFRCNSSIVNVDLLPYIILYNFEAFIL